MEKQKVDALTLTCPQCKKIMTFKNKGSISKNIEETQDFIKDFYQYARYTCECGCKATAETNDWSDNITVCFETSIRLDKYIHNDTNGPGNGAP